MQGNEPFRSRRRRPAWIFLGGVIALTLAIALLLWFVWGFRWPPTAEVVGAVLPTGPGGSAAGSTPVAAMAATGVAALIGPGAAAARPSSDRRSPR